MERAKNSKFIKYYNAARKPDTHKGDYGRVFIVAGSEGMTGAAMLCAEAAVRTGAGLVYLFAPGKILPVYEIGCKEAVKIKVGEGEDAFFKEKHVRQVVDVIKKSQESAGVVVGPGIGRNIQTSKFVKGLLSELSEIDIPVILDADGLNAYKNEQYKDFALPKNTIITPHVGELARLLTVSAEYINKNRTEAAIKASCSINAITVLKGNKSLVCPCCASSEADIYVNSTGNAGMATGGSGDVLAGIISGIIASDKDKKSIFELVCCAVFIHGICGDIAAEKYGERAVKAGDLIEMLKEIHKIEGSIYEI